MQKKDTIYIFSEVITLV